MRSAPSATEADAHLADGDRKYDVRYGYTPNLYGKGEKALSESGGARKRSGNNSERSAREWEAKDSVH